MGICAMCCQQPPPTISSSPLTARNKKVRPLLLELERDFAEHAGEDKHLDQAELTQMWLNAAIKKQGKLGDEEKELITKTAEEFFTRLDMDKNGKVTYAEFMAYSMGGLEDRGELRDMREKINSELAKDPEKLNKLVEKFRSWDKNGDGYVSAEEMEEHLVELQKMAADSGVSNEEAINTAKRMKEELLGAADVDNDGKVDLWEAIAWALGRKRVPVEILLYDISKGATEWLGPLLLGRKDVEAFHSAILVYGSEYWYGGKVFRSDPPCSAQFGDPLRTSPKLTFEPSVYKPELMVVRAGYTFVTHDEFVKFLRDKVVDRYTGLEKYDLLTHSCNHFSDEIMHFLTGHGVPEHITELQRMAESNPGVKKLRPYLNKYLGGFSGESGGGDQLLADQETKRDGGKELDASEVLGEGDVVVVEGIEGFDQDGPLVATIIKEEGGKCDVKFFDPNSGQITNKTGVPTSVIKKRINKKS